MEKGGSTKPWLITASDGINDIPFVVKFWNERDENTQHPIFKEVVGNVLSNQFSLVSPQYSLIDFSKEFVQGVLDIGQRDILKTKHVGLKFGTEYLTSLIVYSESILRASLKDYDFANLFAFDVLLYNFDRGRTKEKPNVLIQKDQFLLIDHELSLAFLDYPNDRKGLNIILEKILAEEIDYPYQKQLCYPYLKNLRASEKPRIFDEFEENLSMLDIRIIEESILELQKLGVSCGHSERLIEYLYTIKKHHRPFCKGLLKCII